MVSCCAFGCTNRTSKKIPGITFHRIPKDPDRQKKWVIAIRRRHWRPNVHSRICSEHFEASDFEKTPQTVRIKDTAIPSVFKGFPNYLQKRASNSRELFQEPENKTTDASFTENSTSADATALYSSNSSSFYISDEQEYHPSKKLSRVLQCDTESEEEDLPTLNLDDISKDQLMAAIWSLKTKFYKYKNKYAEVVEKFEELREEKIKIENTLIKDQEEGRRRIAKLREWCQLEQKAKVRLDENLKLLLEERDSRIRVLQTQINRLKKGGKSNSTKTLPEDCDNELSDRGSDDTKSEDSATSLSNDVSILQKKVERLNHQINRDKKTITAQKNQISLLRKQNENLSQKLEEKVKRLDNVEDRESKLRLEHETVLKIMQDRLKELEKQQEESVMSLAETKKNRHEEMELKES